MMNPPVFTPDTVPATGDPGDDTLRRYRYQWTYAAVLCCMLLDETQEVREIFCEHHEDILIKHVDGRFSGIQVKTRRSDQDLWKSNDEAIIGSCARFVKLESQFPGCFYAFRFLTNHPFYSTGNGKDVRYVLTAISSAATANDLAPSVKKFLDRISVEAGSTTEITFTALSKTDASDGLPKLSDIEVRLAATLTECWDQAKDCSYTAVMRVARHLATECGRASSLSHQDVMPAYLPATAAPEAEELAARIAAKRIDKERVLGILSNGLNETALLHGDVALHVEPGAGIPELLIKKLNAGGFSAVSCNSALDLRDKADYLGIVWTNKYGRVNGLQRYGHIRSLVLTDAARAFETTKNEHHYFGVSMLDDLRLRFRQRGTEGGQLYECSNEHLEGFAYSLTSQCKVQWSVDRPWENE